MAVIDLRDRGGQDLGQNLLQFFMQREQLELQKEAQKLQERQVKIQESEAEQAARIQAAQEQGAQAILGFMAQQSPEVRQFLQGQFPQAQQPAQAFTPNLEPGQAQQVPTQFDPRQIPGEAAQTFVQNLTDLQESQATIENLAARTRQAESDARVSEATEGAIIELQELEPEVRKAQLEGIRAANEETKVATQGHRLQNVYQRMMNERDPQRVNQARALFETGAVTWGQARSAAGLSESDLIPDNTIFATPEGSQMSAQAMKNRGFAQMMQVSHGIINQLTEQGVRLGFLPSLQRQSQSATFDALVNLVSGTDQERLVNAQRMFGDAYRFSLSGQQSSDREALRMLNAIAEQVGDSPETIAQKRALREVMINVTRAKAGGGLDPVQGAQMGLRAARNTGNEETIELFENILEETIASQAGGTPSNSPTDPANVGERLEGLDRLIDMGISGGQ